MPANGMRSVFNFVGGIWAVAGGVIGAFVLAPVLEPVAGGVVGAAVGACIKWVRQLRVGSDGG